MMKHYCDRCGEEIMFGATTRANVLKGRDGTLVWELCEVCSVALQDWVEEGEKP